MTARFLAPAFAFAMLLACGPQDLIVDAPTEASTRGAALTTSETTITFHDGWNISRSNLLVQGQTVKVVYDANRLPQCRGDYNGKPAWSITGYYQLNDGTIGSFEAGGYSPSNGTQTPTFPLTEAGTLKLWFQVTNRWGCSAWDSNFGKNYQFEVGQPPRMVFAADWSERIEGIPGSMPSLKIDYALERLPSCRATYNGFDTWDVLAYYRFDGGAVQYQSVTAVSGYQRSPTVIDLPIPQGAKQLELWFKNQDRGGCVGWDSDFGNNYKVMVN